MIPRQIVIHYTLSSRDRTTILDIDAWHAKRWPNFRSSLNYWVGYGWVILGNGDVIQTRKDTEPQAHTPPNEGRIGIALTLNAGEKPSDAQLQALGLLLTKLKVAHNLEDKDIYAHRELSSTECPGDELFRWLILKRQLSLLEKILRLLQSFFR